MIGATLLAISFVPSSFLLLYARREAIARTADVAAPQVPGHLARLRSMTASV